MIDFHQKLLRNSPVTLNRTEVKLLTLGEVFDMGLDTYLERLQSIIYDVQDLVEKFSEQEVEVNDYQVFLFLLTQDRDFQEIFFEGIKMFTGQTFVFHKEAIVSVREVYDSEGKFEKLLPVQVLTEDYWRQLRGLIRVAHWLPPEEKLVYGTSKAKAIMEKFKRNQEIVRKIKEKKGDSESVELYELIAAVSIKSPSYNLLNVWGLTYYQFFDQYYRLNISDNYDFTMQSLLAGADPKKTKIEHWTSSIDNNKQ